MKKLMVLSSVFAAGAAFASATVDVANSVGILQVTKSLAKQIVAVPFAGYGSGNVNITDLVSPSGLANDTLLRAVDSTGTKYNTWKLSNGAWVSQAAVNITSTSKTVTAAPNASGTTIPRGSAVWLEFAEGSGNPTILGQGAAGGSLTLTANKWNLIGNPGVAAFDILGKVSTPAANDQINVQGANGVLTTYTYSKNKSAWTYRDAQYKVQTISTLNLAAGAGCWYFPKTDGRVVTF